MTLLMPKGQVGLWAQPWEPQQLLQQLLTALAQNSPRISWDHHPFPAPGPGKNPGRVGALLTQCHSDRDSAQSCPQVIIREEKQQLMGADKGSSLPEPKEGLCHPGFALLCSRRTERGVWATRLLCSCSHPPRSLLNPATESTNEH